MQWDKTETTQFYVVFANMVSKNEIVMMVIIIISLHTLQYFPQI